MLPVVRLLFTYRLDGTVSEGIGAIEFGWGLGRARIGGRSGGFRRRAIFLRRLRSSRTDERIRAIDQSTLFRVFHGFWGRVLFRGLGVRGDLGSDVALTIARGAVGFYVFRGLGVVHQFVPYAGGVPHEAW